jgi:hypothetical protein
MINRQKPSGELLNGLPWSIIKFAKIHVLGDTTYNYKIVSSDNRCIGIIYSESAAQLIIDTFNKLGEKS